MRVLAGDIGGTNARLAIIEIDEGGVQLLHQRSFVSRDFPGLAPIVHAFLADQTDLPTRACFGVACPVLDGMCRATNLPWAIDIASLRTEVNLPHVALINDLRAAAYGVPRLGPSDFAAIQAGEPKEHGTMAIIAAGTGLGEAFLSWNGDDYRVHGSEGGHVSVAARTELQWGLVKWLARRFGHVSCERVLSGPGLVNVYQYLAESGVVAEQAAVRAEMEHQDPAAVIGQHAIAGTDPLSEQALDLFATMFGAEAGNLALAVMATGGVYVAGGVAPHILPKLQDGTFITAFRDKGRLSDVVARVPVHVIVNPHVGLIGAAAAALHQ